MVEMAKNVDGYRISTFFHKDRGGKLVAGPAWDYDLALSNANYLTGWDPAGWYGDLVGDASKPYFSRLLQDPDFAQLLVDTYAGFRSSVWSTDYLLDKIDAHAIPTPAMLPNNSHLFATKNTEINPIPPHTNATT